MHRIRKREIPNLETTEDMKQFLLRSLRRGGISPAKVVKMIFYHPYTKECVGSCDSWDEFEKAFDDAIERVGEEAEVWIDFQTSSDVTESFRMIPIKEENRQ